MRKKNQWYGGLISYLGPPGLYFASPIWKIESYRSPWSRGQCQKTPSYKEKEMIIVQFPNCSRYSKFILVILKLIIVTVQPHCNGHFCWQASLLHLRPKFSVTFTFTITGINGVHKRHIHENLSQIRKIILKHHNRNIDFSQLIESVG